MQSTAWKNWPSIQHKRNFLHTGFLGCQNCSSFLIEDTGGGSQFVADTRAKIRNYHPRDKSLHNFCLRSVPQLKVYVACHKVLRCSSNMHDFSVDGVPAQTFNTTTQVCWTLAPVSVCKTGCSAPVLTCLYSQLLRCFHPGKALPPSPSVEFCSSRLPAPAAERSLFFYLMGYHQQRAVSC